MADLSQGPKRIITSKVAWAAPYTPASFVLSAPQQSQAPPHDAPGRGGLHRVMSIVEALLLWVEAGLLGLELSGLFPLYAEMQALQCMEPTLQGARALDKMAERLMPASDAVGRLATYVLVACVLGTLSLTYFSLTFLRFALRSRSSGCTRQCLLPFFFARWWEQHVSMDDDEDAAHDGDDGPDKGMRMDSWCGDESGCPVTGPRIFAVTDLVTALLSYFGTGLRQWATSSEEHVRLQYPLLGWVSLAFLVLSVKSIASLLSAVAFKFFPSPGCKRARPVLPTIAVIVTLAALLSANQSDTFPCDTGGYSYASPPPSNAGQSIVHGPCGALPEQEFAARSLGVYYVPVTASLQLTSHVGTLRSDGYFSSQCSCDATLALAPRGTTTVRFNKYLASGALFALTPPMLCADAVTALPPPLRTESGYGAANVLHAWLGYRAPTAVDASNARTTVQLLAGAQEEYLPAPPMRWVDNVFPPHRPFQPPTVIPMGAGCRFSLSEVRDNNPFDATFDSAVSVCANAANSSCQHSWRLADLGGVASGLDVQLGELLGETWVWRIEPVSQVTIQFGSLDICAAKEDLSK